MTKPAPQADPRAAPKKRLALFLPDMRGGGAERVALTLAHGFLDHGHEVDLVLAQAIGELLPLLRPEVNVVDLAAPRFRYALFPLVRYLRARRPDAMHVMMWPLPLLAITARALSRVTMRLVISEHIAMSRKYTTWTQRAAVRASVGAMYRSADKIVAVSNGVADDMASLTGFPRGEIEVIYNPLDLPATLPQTETHAHLWPASEDRLLGVGSLKPQKNFALLIRALRLVREQRDASLLILGSGSMQTQLQEYAKRQGVGDYVRFESFSADPWPYYRSASLFVLSSDYEGFGNVIVEALYAGLPVVSTDCPSGPKEILENGVHGRLVRPGDESELAAAILLTCATPRNAASRLRGEQRARALAGNIALSKHVSAMASV